MTKNQAPTGISWAKASDELKAKVKYILQMSQNNRYSVSRIYAAYNAVFELSEAPQTCSTCLTSRATKLRKWWREQSPKEVTTADATPVIGEDGFTDEGREAAGDMPKADEAGTYDEVVAKYKINFDEESEADVLQDFIQAGNSAQGLEGGITPNELALIEERYSAFVGAKADAALIAVVDGKLEALGITADSSSEDTLEAYRLLAEDVSNTQNEQAFYNAQILIHEREAEGKQDSPAEGVARYDMGEGLLGMDFTPSAEDPLKGTVLNADGSKVAAGTYATANGTTLVVQMGGKARIKTD